MKKVLALSLILTLCIPFSGAFADKYGKWNYAGKSKFRSESKRIKTDVGDFKACLVSGPERYYSLYQDTSFSPDYKKYGTEKLKKGKCIVFSNIDKGKVYFKKILKVQHTLSFTISTSNSSFKRGVVLK